MVRNFEIESLFGCYFFIYCCRHLFNITSTNISNAILVSFQETDYMGVVFHFYNSDDEDEDDEEETSFRHAKKHAKKQALIE